MADRIGVFNMALGHLSADTILDEEEDSTEADALRTYEDAARKITQSRFNWGFNRRRRKLSQITLVTGLLPAVRYQYPTDCLVMRAVIRAEDIDPFVTSMRPSFSRPPVPFETEYTVENGKTIITPLEDAHGIYTMDLKNIELWSEEAALSYSYILASLSAMKITRNDNDVKRCLQLFNSSFSEATTADANEGALFEEPESELERSRW